MAHSGRTWTWGAGFNVELGTSAFWATLPQPIGSLQQVLAILQLMTHAGLSALMSSGPVWTWGAGFNGELGTSASWATSPQPIGSPQQVLPPLHLS